MKQRQIQAVAVVFIFIASFFYLPLSLAADESIVGVGYKSWTEAECRKTFGSSFPVTIDPYSLGISDKSLIAGKGPLVHDGVETGCYCGGEYVLTEQKTACVLCSRYGPGLVYFTNKNAVETAKVEINGKDLGCRCSATYNGRDFDRVENNKCIYVNKDAENAKCRAQYGSTGVKACSQGDSEHLGTADGVNCCCAPGYVKVADSSNPGGYKCVASTKGAHLTKNDLLCAEKWENSVECPDDLSEEDKDLRFTGPYMGVTCCCSPGYVYSSGACVPEKGPCDVLFPGSVEAGRADQGDIRVGDPYNERSWDPEKLKEMKKEGLECYCAEGTLPISSKETGFLVQCAGTTTLHNVLFMGLTPQKLAAILDDPADPKKTTFFNIVRNNGQNGHVINIPLKGVKDGPYHGIILTETGTLSFVNRDTARGGRVLAEIALAITESIGGGWAAKLSTRFLTKEGVEAIVEGELKRVISGQQLSTLAARELSSGRSFNEVFQILRTRLKTQLSTKLSSLSDDAADALVSKYARKAARNALRKATGRKFRRLLLASSSLWSDPELRWILSSLGPKSRFLLGRAVVGLGYSATFSINELTAGHFTGVTRQNIDKWVTLGSGAISGAITGAQIGSAVGAAAGPFAFVGTLIGAGVGAVAGGLAEYGLNKVDPTNMDLIWNSQNLMTVKNLLVSDSLDKCNTLPPGSSLEFVHHTYGDTIDGWELKQLVFTPQICTLGGGGGFMIGLFTPVASRISCTGCTKIDPGQKCGDLEATPLPGGAAPICCNECRSIEGSVDVYTYKTGQGVGVGGSVPGLESPNPDDIQSLLEA